MLCPVPLNAKMEEIGVGKGCFAYLFMNGIPVDKLLYLWGLNSGICLGQSLDFALFTVYSPQGFT